MTREEFIKAKILESGDTLKDFAKKIDMPYSTLFSILKNVGGASIDNVMKICEGLHISPDVLEGVTRLSTGQFPKSIPILGRVVAGNPNEAIECINGWLNVDSKMAQTGEYFALEVTGQSMEPQICEGDIVIVHKQSNINSGETAIVQINGDEATMKKVLKQENGITLIANNLSVYQPHFYTNEQIENYPIQIMGKVIEIRRTIS